VLDDPGYRARAEAARLPEAARSPGDKAVDVLERVAERTIRHEADVAPSAHVSDAAAVTVAADQGA
jgi:hypothetical protein